MLGLACLSLNSDEPHVDSTSMRSFRGKLSAAKKYFALPVRTMSHSEQVKCLYHQYSGQYIAITARIACTSEPHGGTVR